MSLCCSNNATVFFSRCTVSTEPCQVRGQCTIGVSSIFLLYRHCKAIFKPSCSLCTTTFILVVKSRTRVFSPFRNFSIREFYHKKLETGGLSNIENLQYFEQG